jgi:hypothetical protein
MSRADPGPLLQHIDNPMNENRWGYGSRIADRAGISRRAISQKLVTLEQDFRHVTALADQMIDVGQGDEALRMAREEVRRRA